MVRSIPSPAGGVLRPACSGHSLPHGERMKREDLEAELEREHPSAFAWALRCAGGGREEAEDALHTAYERILDGRAGFAGRSSFRTWLFGVIRRAAWEERRRGWLRLDRLRRWFGGAPPADSAGAGAGAGRCGAGEELERRETARRLGQAIA